jgi:hypothetical protein
MASKSQPTIDNILCWLPADTQSLLVTNGPYQLPEAAAVTDTQMRHRKASETIPLLSVLPAVEISSQKFYPVIAKRQVNLAVEALGPYPNLQQTDPTILSRGLFIASFKDDEDWHQVVTALGKRASSISKYQQVAVYAFAEPSDFSRPDLSGSINVYVCSPEPAMLVISANLPELHNTLDRMQQKARIQVALPQTLPEWKYLDRTAQFWAIRHCGDSSSDRSLPPGAIGITVDYRKSDDIVHITYLSTEDKFNMLRAFGQMWSIPIRVVTTEPERSSAIISGNDLPGFPASLFTLLGHVSPAI